MLRRAALIVLGIGALLLAPGAPGVPDVPGDPTPPVVTPVVSGTLGSAGWYTSNVTVNWSVVDSESIILSTSGCNTVTLNPNTTGTELTCRAESDGGVSTVSKTFKIDKTPPSATATPSRGVDANGWYNHALNVGFTGSDGTSGLDSCSPAATYAGPDTLGTSVSGTCRDKAGNTAPASLALKYDATAPGATGSARAPDANGWHNHAVTVTFQGSDGMSGIDACTQVTYAGPDDPSVALTGTCVDRAGNRSSSSVFTLKYDETDPVATATASRVPNPSGWYTSPLSVSFAATDAMSGLESCDVPKSYSGPDSAGTSVSGACPHRAGNVATPSVSLRYDATAPQATATPGRAADANGWYNHSLAVSFSGTDATSGIDSCDAAKTYAGPDTTSASVSGSCRDRAGNSTASSLSLRYDATGPQATASPSRQPNANGWYNAPLTVDFAATDGTSGVDSCPAPKSYAGPDNAAASVSGTCLDRAGNGAVAAFSLKYDATAPTTTATPARQPNGNGWYNAPLSVSFAATDTTSTVDSCDAAKTYAGPDSSSTSVTGSCKDKAGNLGAASYALKYDATAPTATASRPPNGNGWYNAPLSVDFTAADATSTVESCDADKTYSGPDAASATVTGSCTDKAGNAAAASLALKYDATAPVTTATPARQANANGWYSAPVSVSFAATDATSTVDSCDTAKSYSGPDSATAGVSGTCRDYAGPDTASTSVSGSCRDRAGNQGTATTFGFKYDATAPEVTGAVPARNPDRADWYNHPVAFAVQGVAATSGLDACPIATYAGPDGADASIAAECIDNAGNTGARPFPLRYDATGPTASARGDRPPDANGWYNRPLTVSFAGADAVSGLESCDGPKAYDGPDSAQASVGGTCLDRAGNVGVAPLAVGYDATAPAVTGVQPSRPPDANGWYNRPLNVRFQGSDATSAIDSCTEASYGGPDAAQASVSGSCRDRAGNTSSPAAFALRYDSTAPTIGGVTAKAGNAEVALTWTTSDDAVRVELRRSGVLVYRGSGTSYRDRRLRNGIRYRYELSAYDEAGNAATSGTTARPTAPLYAPPAGAVVSAPPRLAWAAVEGATYYNVQILRRGRILSAWPKGTSFRMRRTWTYAGRRYHLTRGRYRWFVRPGYGRRSAKRFGSLLGSSSFVVR